MEKETRRNHGETGRTKATPPALNFKPITEGLGFHPFSDGLPYAPVGKTNPQKPAYEGGSGATAAGAPVFVTRPSLPKAPSMPSAAQLAQIARPGRPDWQADPRRVSVPVATHTTHASSASPTAVPTPGLEARLGFGYLLKRTLAYLIDSVLNMGLAVAALSAALWRQNLNPETLFSPGILALCLAFLFAFNWALVTAQEIAFGTSVGKRFFRLFLDGSASSIFIRAFFFLPSVAFCGLGLLWALFDSKKRCWHDLVVEIQPVEIARL